jgi:aminoglycoside phosphotransferase (APT) family kinase protein
VLGGGITNHNLRARFGGNDYVLRLAGRDTDQLGIDRAVERAAAELAHAAGVAPAVAAQLGDPACLVTAYVAAEPVTPERVRAIVAEVAVALRGVHGAGSVPASFSPFRVGERYAQLAAQRGVALPALCAEAAAAAAEIERTLGTPVAALCHNDLLAANLLEAEGRLWIVDWEYAGMGDPFFDLGNLSVNNEFTVADDQRLVEAYFGAPDESRLSRVRLMRAASDYREGMWGVAQQALSDLDFDFVAYADEHLGRMLGSDWEEWAHGAAA